MDNKFFTYDDVRQDKVIFDLEPMFWWSRIFEYKFCLDKAEEGQVCLDACTGSFHPFKYALADKCKEVHAVDILDLSYDNLNEATLKRFGVELDKQLYDKVKFNQCSITNMPYEDKFFDSIFAISCLEHMEEDKIIQGLKEFKRTLKDDGRCYITLDAPTIAPQRFIELAREANLVVDGKCDYKIPENAITSDYFGEPRLYCFSIVLRKPKPFGRQKKNK